MWTLFPGLDRLEKTIKQCLEDNSQLGYIRAVFQVWYMGNGGGNEEVYRTTRAQVPGMELTEPKRLIRTASVVAGIDIGGKYTKVVIETVDGRVGEAAVPTYQHGEDEPISERVQGLAGSTVSALLKAAEGGDIAVGEIDAIGFGAPGARDPLTKRFRMPNALGTDPATQIGNDPDTRKLAEVDFEGKLRDVLDDLRLRRDAIIRGGNDCDVAAAATKIGEMIVLNEGIGEFGKLQGEETSFYALLGTGIGTGSANARGLIEGAHGAMEGGHVEVVNPFIGTHLEGLIRCGCHKPGGQTVCIEAIASTTGQERIMKVLVMKAFAGEIPMDTDQMRLLLDKTQEWNRGKLEREGPDLSAIKRQDLESSIRTIDMFRERLASFAPDELTWMLAKNIVFDSETIDKLAIGEKPQVEIAAEAMAISGKAFGQYLRNVITLSNPKQIVIGGGGAQTFRFGDRNTNPFRRAMMDELEGDKYDRFGSIAKTWIVAAVDKKVNLGIQGSMAFAKKLYEQGVG
jgi:predicted NBD/HSP70 family sugar kinase